MRFFLLNEEKKYKILNKNLNVRGRLCDVSWVVFDDASKPEVLVFQKDGSLLIFKSGKITLSRWEYVSGTNSLWVSVNKKSYNFRPIYMDQVLFALQIEGTDQTVFLINENNVSSFAPKTIEDVMDYLRKIETQTFDSKDKKSVSSMGFVRQIKNVIDMLCA